jgi:nitric oxide reductase NorQ protein
MAKRAPARNFPHSRFPEVFPMTAPAIPAPAPKGRLGNGQLRRQVAEWLAARPGPHTVGEIAKDLGRLAGAVGNALTTLADRPRPPALRASRCATRPTPPPAAITPEAPSPPKSASAAPPAAPKPAARVLGGRPG